MKGLVSIEFLIKKFVREGIEVTFDVSKAGRFIGLTDKLMGGRGELLKISVFDFIPTS